MLTPYDYKNIRTLAVRFDRLVAIAWLREVHKLPFLVAKMVVEDVTTDQPWTRPEIGYDINMVCDTPRNLRRLIGTSLR